MKKVLRSLWSSWQYIKALGAWSSFDRADALGFVNLAYESAQSDEARVRCLALKSEIALGVGQKELASEAASKARMLASRNPTYWERKSHAAVLSRLSEVESAFH